MRYEGMPVGRGWMEKKSAASPTHSRLDYLARGRSVIPTRSRNKHNTTSTVVPGTLGLAYTLVSYLSEARSCLACLVRKRHDSVEVHPPTQEATAAKPWRWRSGCPPKPWRRRACFHPSQPCRLLWRSRLGGFCRRSLSGHGCKAVGLHLEYVEGTDLCIR